MWVPGDDIRAGDYGTVEGGVFDKKGSLSELDINVETRRSQPRDFEFRTKGIVTTALKADVDAGVVAGCMEVRFDGADALFIYSPGQQTVSLKRIARSLEQAACHAQWRMAYKVVTKVETARDSVLVMSADTASGSSSEAKPSKLAELAQIGVGGEVRVGGKVKVVSAGAIALRYEGVSGPLFMTLHEVDGSVVLPPVITTLYRYIPHILSAVVVALIVIFGFIAVRSGEPSEPSLDKFGEFDRLVVGGEFDRLVVAGEVGGEFGEFDRLVVVGEFDRLVVAGEVGELDGLVAVGEFDRLVVAGDVGGEFDRLVVGGEFDRLVVGGEFGGLVVGGGFEEGGDVTWSSTGPRVLSVRRMVSARRIVTVSREAEREREEWEAERERAEWEAEWERAEWEREREEWERAERDIRRLGWGLAVTAGLGLLWLLLRLYQLAKLAREVPATVDEFET